MALGSMVPKLGTRHRRREDLGRCGRPPNDRWYGLTDPAGITLSGRAERTGYDLASVRRGTLITEGTELAEEAAMLVFLKECEKVFDGCNFGIRLVARERLVSLPISIVLGLA